MQHQGHGGPWARELETSRSVGSEQHGVPKGPLHLSWSLELEGDTVVGHPQGAVPEDAVGSRCHCWTFLAPGTTRWWW